MLNGACGVPGVTRNFRPAVVLAFAARRRDREADYLRFAADSQVPFDNNHRIRNTGRSVSGCHCLCLGNSIR